MPSLCGAGQPAARCVLRAQRGARSPARSLERRGVCVLLDTVRFRRRRGPAASSLMLAAVEDGTTGMVASALLVLDT